MSDDERWTAILGRLVADGAGDRQVQFLREHVATIARPPSACKNTKSHGVRCRWSRFINTRWQIAAALSVPPKCTLLTYEGLEKHDVSYWWLRTIPDDQLYGATNVVARDASRVRFRPGALPVAAVADLRTNGWLRDAPAPTAWDDLLATGIGGHVVAQLLAQLQAIAPMPDYINADRWNTLIVRWLYGALCRELRICPTLACVYTIERLENAARQKRQELIETFRADAMPQAVLDDLRSLTMQGDTT